jgi:hypothetical protein
MFECNDQSLDYYTSELRGAVDAEIRPFLVSSLDGEDAPPGSTDCDLVVTTFFHVAEVRRRMRHIDGLRDLELFAVSVRPHLEVLQELSQLPSGTTLGILYFEDPHFTPERLQQMVEHVGHANLPNLARIEPVYVKGEVTSDDVAGVDGVMVRPENRADAHNLQQLGIPVIEYRNVLDGASLALIREILSDIREVKIGHSAELLDMRDISTELRRA